MIMASKKIFRKPSLVRIFLGNFLKVTTIITLLFCIGMWVVDRVYLSSQEEKAEVDISDLREEILADVKDYYPSGKLLSEKKCELRRKVLDLWENDHVAIRIEIKNEPVIDSSRCLMMKCFKGNKEYDMFLDDYDYKEVNENFDELLKYSYDSSYIIQVNDAYVNWNHRSFYPGQICVVDRGTHELIQSIDLTPSDESLLKLYRHAHGYDYGSDWEPMSICVIGNENASNIEYEYTEQIHVDSTRHSTLITFSKAAVSSRDSFVDRVSNYIKPIFISVICIDLILSLFISLVSYYREKNLYEIISYRRKTTDAMAHDLKTPLAITNIYYEKLKDNKDSEKADTYLVQMKKSLDYMNELINNILIFSKTQYSNMDITKASIDIRKELEALLSELKPAMNSRHLTCALNGEARYKINALLWKQAMGNLITNAINYATSDSQIDICLGKDEIVIKNSTENVVDKPMDLLQPFVKGNSVRGENSGSGLGLAVANDNLSRMGFALIVENVDKTFIVRIRKNTRKKKWNKAVAVAFVALLVLVQTLSFVTFFRKGETDDNPLLQSRYEFLVTPSDKDSFYKMIEGVPAETQNYADVQIRSSVVAESDKDTVDFVVAAYYPNIYEGREIYSYGTHNPRNLKDWKIVITSSFEEKIKPFYGVNEAVYINGRTYSIWGEATIVDEPVINGGNAPSCWVNANTFFKLSDTYDQVIFQYEAPLSEEELSLLKSYIYDEYSVVSFIGPQNQIVDNSRAQDIAFLVIINLLIVGCYVWIGYRYKWGKEN